MNPFNRLLILMGAALLVVVLNCRELSTALLVIAMIYGCRVKRITWAVMTRKEILDEPNPSPNLVTAVLQGMDWAQKGMVYQIPEGEAGDPPSYALVGRTVVDTFSGQEFFLPQVEVVPAGFVPIPAFAPSPG